MNYYIGIDGGGTKTKAVLIDEKMEILSEAVGSPSNFLVFDINDVANSIINLMLDVCKNGNVSLNDVTSTLIGTAGAGRIEDAERLEKIVRENGKAKSLVINNFKVESDARIAIEGAFSGKPGSILIAGTGSIMYGKDSDGKIHRVGGFGRILGDEGSGFHIGRAGLTAIAKSFDKRIEKTLLTELVKNKFGISDTTQLINKVYKENLDIPQIAPLVIEAAEKNDEICKTILDSEIVELLEHIHAMKKLITVKELFISLIGGTITTNNYYANLFKEKAEKIPEITIIDAELPPQMGAALMATNNS
jgi:N-acetylglucosamine kinase-like BadF-type ATPase